MRYTSKAKKIDDNGVELYKCEYCETWYHPKKRFSQKYCCESCRVLACRERTGSYLGVLGGTLPTKRNKTTMTDLLKSNDALALKVESLIHQNKMYQELVVDRSKHEFEMLRIEMHKGFKSIKSKLNWVMILDAGMSIAGPIFADWIVKLLKNPKNLPNDAEAFKKRFNLDFGKILSLEMLEKVLKLVDEIKNSGTV